MYRPVYFGFLFFFLLSLAKLSAEHESKIMLGIDVLLTTEYQHLLKGKKIGLITNHTAVNAALISTIDVLENQSKKLGFTLTALFAPEHGMSGSKYAGVLIDHEKQNEATPLFNLHGKTNRPTKEMLDLVDLLIFDIQDIGSRSYTYMTTLFYAMEAAAKCGKRVIVLDRPNPMNGLTVDGPLMEEKWRSMVGYINVPYCHGMTIGELAYFFNEEYKIGCRLNVIPMKGWRRDMSFEDTGLVWIPTSPQIPEARTAWYYPTTGGILGELHFVSIGIGYTLPFKLVGAPWIDAERFSDELNKQNFPGVVFRPFHYQPFFGKFAKQECHGVLIVITDFKKYKPFDTQYLILGILKHLYPKKFQEAMETLAKNKQMFCKINGGEEIYQIMEQERHFIWKLKAVGQKDREHFLNIRKKYLIPAYG